MIPDYQSIMLPLLEFISDGKEYKMRNVTDELADEEVILKIYTCLGEKIAEEKVGIGEQKIDLINYSSGVYFMEISNSYNFKILKIIKVE